MTVWLLWLAVAALSVMFSLAPWGRRRLFLLCPALTAIACLAPFLLPEYRIGQLTRMWALAISLLGLNLVAGYGGLLALGQGAFMLMGAYTMALLSDRTTQLGLVDSRPWPFWAALIVAGIVAGAAGLTLGAVSLRWKGVFLALGTFAAALALPHVLLRYDGFSGGARGIRFPSTPPPEFLRGLLSPGEWLYFLGLLSFLACLLINWNLVRGTWGRALVAARDSELGARSMGVHVNRVRVEAFALGAAFGGIAGALYAMPLRFVMHETIEPLQSIYLFLALIVGGLGYLGAAIPAAALLVYLPTDLVQVVGRMPGLGVEIVARAPGLIQGIVVVLILLLMPQGISSIPARLQPSGVTDACRKCWTLLASLLAATSAFSKGVIARGDQAMGRRENPDQEV